MAMADYLAETKSKEGKIKADEMGHKWFTVNGIIRKDTPASANQNWRGESKQPLGEKFATATGA